MNDQARSVKGQASGSPPREGQTTCEGTVLGSRDEDLRPHKDIKAFAPTGSSGQDLSRSAVTTKLSTVTVAPPPRPADGERRQSAKKDADLVDFEKFNAEKFKCVFSHYRSYPYSRERAV